MVPAPIFVEFPLRGEWVAYHTPAEQVPSHGTDQFGQRYAYDFIRIDKQRKGWKFYRASTLRYCLFGVRLSNCYGWSEPIHAPFDGTVIAARDGWPDRNRVHFLTEIAALLKNALSDARRDIGPIAGNHIILKMDGDEVYAFIAHLRKGSIQVREGDEVHTGQQLAEVGHSGNSTAPHLHFHLMDKPNVFEAGGLPCGFKQYESFRDGAWIKVHAGIPGKREFIRYTA